MPFVKQCSSVTGVNIRRGIREKIRRGVFNGRAPLGYYNEPRLRTIEPHPEQFAKLKRVLELFATGQYTLTAIQRELTLAGIVGRQNKKPLPLSSIGNLLRCHFYYGVFLHKGELHQGVHVPMISKNIPAKRWLEPPFARSDLNRFVQKSLEFIG